ncbi:MAG: hypothetical protein IPF87_04570 [Gemmatimonadetes bacterium]|jgi:hypothetical protein|nr:hypothetical protein [Gemmatimonadota bacterium]
MFVAMLRAQWIWTRAIMLFFLAAGFALPVLSVPMSARFGIGWISANGYVEVGGMIGLLVAITVCLAAVALVVQNWSVDDRGRHVYALSLPIARRRYLLYRLGAGFLLLGMLAVAIWLGGAAASGLLELPESLHAYPASLALRALMAAWLVHALAFLVRFGAGQRARGVVFGALILLFLFVLLPAETLPAPLTWLSLASRALVLPGGPFGILVSPWSFIDV